MAPKYNFKYFGLPALGEPIRILLHLGKFDWEDEVVAMGPAWAEIKPKTKWGQLPLLTTPEGKEMTQSTAIVRYLGKKVSVDGKLLYPECPDKAFDVDEMIAALEDVRQTMVPTFGIADQAEKEAARAALVAADGKMTVLLQKVEKFAGDKYIVGDSTTVADIWAFMLFNLLRCGFLDGFPKDYLGAYPKLTAIVAGVAALPAVKEHIDSKVSGGNGMYTCMQA